MLLEIAPASQIVGVLVYVMLGTTFMLVAQKGLVSAIHTYAIQTLCLGLIALVAAATSERAELGLVGLFTVVFKAGFVSWLLLRIMKRISVKREMDLFVGIPSSLIAILLLTGSAFAISAGIRPPASALSPDALPISLAITFSGIFIMATRKKAITQAIGLLMAENGVFLAALTLTYGMPFLIEMGVFFDVLTISVVLGIFVFRINETFSSIDTTRLGRLSE